MPERQDLYKDAEKAAIVALSLVGGIGWKRFVALKAAFGSARVTIDSPPARLLSVPGVGPKLARAIASSSSLDKATVVFNRCRELGIKIIAYSDPDYPARLLETADPPLVLYMRGSVDLCYRWSVAIVGTRRPTVNGRLLARRFADELAQAGWHVISGLAVGIDAAAHEGALAAGGKTVAVLPGGIDRVYPPENAQLAERIAGSGALISEAPPGTQAAAGMFPARNRLISALSLGCLVIEAPSRSGALITARFAMEHNREVFAVPGAPYSPQASGCNALLRDGVNWALGSEDVIQVLTPIAGGPPPCLQSARIELGASQAERRPRIGDSQGVGKLAEVEVASALNEKTDTVEARRVLTALESGATTLDEVSQNTGMAPAEAAVQLSLLELCGKVTGRAGRYYVVAGDHTGSGGHKRSTT